MPVPTAGGVAALEGIVDLLGPILGLWVAHRRAFGPRSRARTPLQRFMDLSRGPKGGPDLGLLLILGLGYLWRELVSSGPTVPAPAPVGTAGPAPGPADDPAPTPDPGGASDGGVGWVCPDLPKIVSTPLGDRCQYDCENLDNGKTHREIRPFRMGTDVGTKKTRICPDSQWVAKMLNNGIIPSP